MKVAYSRLKTGQNEIKKNKNTKHNKQTKPHPYTATFP